MNPKLLTLALLLAPLAAAAQTFTFSGGSGTQDDPYLISSIADLDALNDMTNYDAGDGTQQTFGKHFLLTQDITEPFTGMIGTEANFAGHFDGGGHCITLAISRPWDRYPAGLFGSAGYGSIHDLAVDGEVNVRFGAAIVGNPYAAIQLYNLANYANVTSESTSTMAGVGGIIGNIVSQTSYTTTGVSVRRCANFGTVSCPGSCVGGVIGYSGQQVGNTIEDIANYGEVVCAGVNERSRVGGCIGNPMWNDQLRRVVNFGTLSSDTINGCLGNANASEMTDIYYDRQYAHTIHSIPAQEFNTADALGEGLAAKLGDNWVYADGMLPLPDMGGMEDDPRARLCATPVILAAGDWLRHVTRDFNVSTASGVLWSPAHEHVFIGDNGLCEIDGSGEETLTATLNGHSRSVSLHVDAAAAIAPPAKPHEAEKRFPTYNLRGEQVGEGYQGIVISQGKKTLRK